MKKWGTPTSRDWKDGGGLGDVPTNGLLGRQVVREWSTPSVADTTGGHRSRSGTRSDELLLNGQVTKWPTPTTQDSRSSGSMYPKTATHQPGVTLTDAAVRGGRSMSSRRDQTTPTNGANTSSDGRVLNPRFVEALMGFPKDWTACDSSETQSSPNKPLTPSECSLDDSENGE